MLFSILPAAALAVVIYFCISGESHALVAVYLLAPPPFAIAGQVEQALSASQRHMGVPLAMFAASIPWFTITTFPLWYRKSVGNLTLGLQTLFICILWLITIPLCLVFILPDLRH
jgi:hypothetical protein